MKDSPDPKAEWEQRHKAQQEVQRCIRRALEGDAQKPLREWLYKIGMAASYTPGKTSDAVAWNEGRRAIATFILSNGGYNVPGSDE